MNGLIGLVMLSSASVFGLVTIGILLTDYARRKQWQRWKQRARHYTLVHLEKSRQTRWGGPLPPD